MSFKKEHCDCIEFTSSIDYKPGEREKDEKFQKDMKSYILRNYGKKCSEFCITCACCVAWHTYDMFFGWNDGR
jgi:hypothetical protein